MKGFSESRAVRQLIYERDGWKRRAEQAEKELSRVKEVSLKYLRERYTAVELEQMTDIWYG